jgi:hypothetical protein
MREGRTCRDGGLEGRSVQAALAGAAQLRTPSNSYWRYKVLELKTPSSVQSRMGGTGQFSTQATHLFGPTSVRSYIERNLICCNDLSSIKFAGFLYLTARGISCTYNRPIVL